jgi:monoamine oxidase
MSHDEPIAILGAGVSGLYAASMLTSRGVPCQVFESRNRLGGRALSALHLGGTDGVASHFDLGPAWFWPDAQPAIAALASRLGLPVIPQYARGAMRVERFRLEAPQSFVPEDGTIPDALRFRDGVQALVAALASTIPQSAIHLSARVTHITRHMPHGVTLTLDDGRELAASAAILCLPPRLIASRITFDPPLADATLRIYRATPTWMAPHAKALAVYATPFWRAAGYSGMASSFVGPLQEIHDASPETGPGALFGFVGIGVGTRAALGEAALRSGVIAQLVRLFGAQAESPLEVYIKDWAADQDTTTPADLEPTATPHGPGGAQLAAAQWDGCLVPGGAEVALEHPGYLEGAIRAAERAVELVRRQGRASARPPQ